MLLSRAPLPASLRTDAICRNRSLITYGLLHEKILKEPYMTPEGISERFQSSFFIVCANRAMAMVVSIIAIFVSPLRPT